MQKTALLCCLLALGACSTMYQNNSPAYEQSVSEPRLGDENAGDRVFFAYDSSALSAGARATLDKQAGWFKQNPSRHATIEGHADERGTREYNLALGQRRAHAVKQYLVAAGVPPVSLAIVSFGKERPDAAGHNEEAWAKNRRAVTVLPQ